MRKEETTYLGDLSDDMRSAYVKLYGQCNDIVFLRYAGAEPLGKLCKRYGARLYSYGNVVVMFYHGKVQSSILIYPHKLHVFEFPTCESAEDAKKTSECKRRFITQIANLYPNSANELTLVTRFKEGSANCE